MTQDPSPENNKPARRPHPLEQQPTPPSGGDNNPLNTGERRRAMLYIPVVKPRVTQGLIAINVLIFVIAFWGLSRQQYDDLYQWGANNQEYVLKFGEYHRLITAMFLHANLAHVFFNMYALYAIGQSVERFYGHLRYIIIYFLGGITGSVLSVLLNASSTYSVGASGAVFAVFGAEIVFIYKHRKLLGETGRAQLRQLIIIAVINFGFGFATTLNTGGVQIDNWGHIGGMLGGIGLAWIISPFFLLKRHPSDEMGFTTVDVNPFEKQQQPILAYVSGLLLVIIVATVLARGGF